MSTILKHIFKWGRAPIKTSWGDGMMVADVGLDKDSTVSLYAHADDIAKVESHFNGLAPDPSPTVVPQREIRVNAQPISKKDMRDDSKLWVHSVFHTIQGEGPFSGQPAIFIRLIGCNLQCPGCDTEYTDTPLIVPLKAPQDIFAMFNRKPSLVVITGGEPFRQNITPLVRAILRLGSKVQIETNGTYAPPSGFAPLKAIYGDRVTVVVSPKTGKVNPHTEAVVDAYKYVLHHEHINPQDGLPTLALGHSAVPHVARPHVGHTGPVYIQPMDCNDDAENQKNIEQVVRSALVFGYTAQLQIHKLLGVA